jgi:hypothetical protein
VAVANGIGEATCSKTCSTCAIHGSVAVVLPVFRIFHRLCTNRPTPSEIQRRRGTVGTAGTGPRTSELPVERSGNETGNSELEEWRVR